MEQLIAKALWVAIVTLCWWNLGGYAPFASLLATEEQRAEGWTRAGLIYVIVINVFTLAMLYFGLTAHWYSVW